MIIDREQILTALAGELFTSANTLGDNPFDMKAAGDDPAIGEPLTAYWMIDANSDVGTSQTITVQSDSDGLGGGTPVTLLTATVLKAALTVASGVHRLGTIDPGLITSGHKYLTAKVTTSGADPTAGKIKVWLAKGTDGVPANAANVI